MNLAKICSDFSDAIVSNLAEEEKDEIIQPIAAFFDASFEEIGIVPLPTDKEYWEEVVCETYKQIRFHPIGFCVFSETSKFILDDPSNMQWAMKWMEKKGTIVGCPFGKTIDTVTAYFAFGSKHNFQQFIIESIVTIKDSKKVFSEFKHSEGVQMIGNIPAIRQKIFFGSTTPEA